jgi:hypothetical protein
MHKIFSIFFLLGLVSISYGQAVVDIPIIVRDDVGHVYTLYFGLDLTATDGIDTNLGEAALPPWTNGFEARFALPPFNNVNLQTFLDYRAPGNPPAFPFTGQKEHRLKYQLGDGGGTVVVVEWNLPSNITGALKDMANNTLATMSGTGSLTVDPEVIVQLKMFIDYLDITPVELSSFTAVVSDQAVLLNWTTASELNNQGFDIERSTSTQNWAKIGYVPGFGTTTERRAYSFVDKNVSTGHYNYRLKQIDFDGTFAYSDEVGIEVDFTPSKYELFQNYPNPFNPTTTIQFQVPEAGNVSIVIYDMLGQVVKELFVDNVQAGNYSVDWNGVNNAGLKMSSGSYIYRMTAGEFVQSKEMILLK